MTLHMLVVLKELHFYGVKLLSKDCKFLFVNKMIMKIGI